MTKYKKVKRNKVNFKGVLRKSIQLPKERHLKYIPFIREYFNLDSKYVILKDYQIYQESKGNWLIMKDNKIVMVLYGHYIKSLYNEVNDTGKY